MSIAQIAKYYGIRKEYLYFVARKYDITHTKRPRDHSNSYVKLYGEEEIKEIIRLVKQVYHVSPRR